MNCQHCQITGLKSEATTESINPEFAGQSMCSECAEDCDQMWINEAYAYSQKWLQFKNWINVRIEDYPLSSNRYSRPLYHTCEFCGSPQADVLLIRESVATGNRYSQYACKRHTGFDDVEPVMITDRKIDYREFCQLRQKVEGI